MAVMAGKDGSVTFKEQAVAYIDNFSINVNIGTSEVSQLGRSWKEYIETVKDWSGSFSGTLDPADPGQKKTLDIITGGDGNGSEGTAEFVVNSALTYTGSILVTSVALGASHGDKVTYSVNFQGSGELAVKSAGGQS